VFKIYCTITRSERDENKVWNADLARKNINRLKPGARLVEPATHPFEKSFLAKFA